MDTVNLKDYFLKDYFLEKNASQSPFLIERANRHLPTSARTNRCPWVGLEVFGNNPSLLGIGYLRKTSVHLWETMEGQTEDSENFGEFPMEGFH